MSSSVSKTRSTIYIIRYFFPSLMVLFGVLHLEVSSS